MMSGLTASVHRRLLNHARATRRPFNEVLQYFALERFLYRLAQSPYRQSFVLKGALMLAAWQAPVSRPTRDIDLLGRLDNRPEHIVNVVREICRQVATEDGLRFDDESAVGETILEGANYGGVRVRFSCYLGKARVPMQIDVGFGDVLVPGPTDVHIPALLDLPPAKVQGYSRESAIAEKLQVIVSLGELNSRMKDFYDIWLLASQYAFEGRMLGRAIRATFVRRDTTLSPDAVAFLDTFPGQQQQAQWKAFMRRNQLDAPPSLREATQVIKAFLAPVLQALHTGHGFGGHWPPGGPWT
jgi:predicted nucleotidyltransferase component of viral defense system